MIEPKNAKYLAQRKIELDLAATSLIERDEKIRELLTNKTAGIPDLVRLTGLTRARIYQIRDKRR